MKQQFIGLMFVLLGVLSMVLAEGDATFAVIAVPFGFWCIMSDKEIIYEGD